MRLKLGVLAAALISAVASPVNAYPDPVPPGGCAGDSIRYQYDASVPSSVRAVTRVGFEKWNALRDRSGNTLANISENAGAETFTVSVSASQTSPGVTNCSNRTITFSQNAVNTGGQWYFRNLATHEMGHALGLDHSGSNDSQNGVRPNMNTCFTISSLNPSLRASDDQGQLERVHDSQKAVTANSSFENGRGHWVKPGGGAYWTATGGQSGPTRLRYLDPGIAGHMLYQAGSLSSAAGRNVFASVFLRRESSAHSGTVTIRLAVRNVTYGVATGCSVGNFESGRDENNRTSVGAWVLRASRTTSPSTSWGGVTTSSYTIPQHADVRIEIDSNIVQGTTRRFVSIDRALVRRT